LASGRVLVEKETGSHHRCPRRSVSLLSYLPLPKEPSRFSLLYCSSVRLRLIPPRPMLMPCSSACRLARSDRPPQRRTSSGSSSLGSARRGSRYVRPHILGLLSFGEPGSQGGCPMQLTADECICFGSMTQTARTPISL
jgi:hypothetical protein